MNEITRSAFTAATNFHEAAIRCLPSASLPTIVPVAMAANLGLACELYLKTNLLAAGRTARGHVLRRLYDDLPMEQRVEIAYRYEVGLPPDDAKFLDSISDVGNAFVEWRYLYEWENIGIRVGALWRLARVLFAHTNEYHREPEMSDAQRQRLIRS